MYNACIVSQLSRNKYCLNQLHHPDLQCIPLILNQVTVNGQNKKWDGSAVRTEKRPRVSVHSGGVTINSIVQMVLMKITVQLFPLQKSAGQQCAPVINAHHSKLRFWIIIISWGRQRAQLTWMNWTGVKLMSKMLRLKQICADYQDGESLHMGTLGPMGDRMLPGEAIMYI